MRTKKNISIKLAGVPSISGEYVHHVKFNKYGKIIESVFIKIDERGKPAV